MSESTRKRDSYLNLNTLEVYILSRELSKIAWLVYQGFSWQLQKTIGDQFLRATDSVGANIAEGYGRFHYLDKIKFYYNARASLFESLHWFKLVMERKLFGDAVTAKKYQEIYEQLTRKLNAFIKSAYPKK